MEHKCKFVKYRNRRSRRHMSYKCHGCFLVVVVRKRTIHRLLTGKYKGPVLLKNAISNRYYDMKDPGYGKAAWDAVFGYEANHYNWR